MAYLWWKTFHLVGVVAWMAGLFYLVRIFVYHAEAREQPQPARGILERQYEIMEGRALRIIATPAMVLTIVTALGILSTRPDLLREGWLHAKLALVVLLVAYHLICASIRAKLSSGRAAHWSGQRFRVLNEVPTVLLVGIVMLAIFKHQFPTSAGVWSIVALTVGLLGAIQLYARHRRLSAAAARRDGVRSS